MTFGPARAPAIKKPNTVCGFAKNASAAKIGHLAPDLTTHRYQKLLIESPAFVSNWYNGCKREGVTFLVGHVVVVSISWI
jgi:hypothetical protein